MTAPPLVVPFTKMSGAGNDFLVLDNRFMRFTDAELEAMAARWCPRRTAVGADGLLALDEPDAPGAHFRMRYRNADGSLATMCGNGARCLARFAARAGLGDASGSESGAGSGTRLVFDTDGGRYTATVPEPNAASGSVTLAMPPPRAFAETAVRTADGRAVWEIWTGTEHAVVFSDAAAGEDLGALAPPVRHDPAFPRGANVNLVQPLADGATLRVRTFEKGVEGETLACGTGAVAAALAARLAGRTDADRVAVEMPGGTLTVGFRIGPADGDDPAAAVSALTLAGPADAVFDGTLEWRG